MPEKFCPGAKRNGCSGASPVDNTRLFIVGIDGGPSTVEVRELMQSKRIPDHKLAIDALTGWCRGQERATAPACGLVCPLSTHHFYQTPGMRGSPQRPWRELPEHTIGGVRVDVHRRVEDVFGWVAPPFVSDVTKELRRRKQEAKANNDKVVQVPTPKQLVYAGFDGKKSPHKGISTEGWFNVLTEKCDNRVDWGSECPGEEYPGEATSLYRRIDLGDAGSKLLQEEIDGVVGDAVFLLIGRIGDTDVEVVHAEDNRIIRAFTNEEKRISIVVESEVNQELLGAEDQNRRYAERVEAVVAVLY
jgi:hypothetical protein